MTGARCNQPSCSGQLEDGYCDTCGMSPATVASTSASLPPPPPGTTSAPSSSSQVGAQTSRSTVSARLGTVAYGSQIQQSVRTRRISSASDKSRLGVGLVTIPTAPELDALKAVMKDPQVDEPKRFCSSCNKPVGRGHDGQPGRTKGFCPSCGAAFDFGPRLVAGTLLNAQYEVVGAIAHGGMGWIYLGRDLNLSGRFVVIKGLVNVADKDLQQAVITEKSFLAEVTHPLIVEVFNFVNHGGVNYIVMEFVGGTSLNDLLKQRLKANNGQYSPLPLAQAIAFVVEIMPAFSYLHNKGLLYCDFKPANLMQVGDGVKLIDLGGVRRIADDASALFGTVGFQGPEVPEHGASVSSDLYTIARTLAVLTFEFRGYQTTYQASLPGPEEVPLFAENDSYYRFLLKATAPQPADRFQTAEEMREQLIGVLREVVASASTDAATRSTPSALFESPGVEAEPHWDDLPELKADPTDPASAWISGISVGTPDAFVTALAGSPFPDSAVVRLELATALLAASRPVDAINVTNEALTRDPWEWRALWVQGLADLQANKTAAAVKAFNAVYGQIPGELAPKLALARACELNGDHEVAARLYEVCAQTDAAYSAHGLMGLARIATVNGRTDDALQALDRVPKTSRFWSKSRAERATTLVKRAGDGGPNAALDLDVALKEHSNSGADTATHAAFRSSVFRNFLASNPTGVAGVSIGGVRGDARSIRDGLETALREEARFAETREQKVALIDEANRVRNRTLV